MDNQSYLGTAYNRLTSVLFPFVPEVNQTDLINSVKNDNLVWVEKDNNLLKKYQHTMSLKITPNIVGVLDLNTGVTRKFNQTLNLVEISIDTDSTETYFDYNKPAAIVVPKEAINRITAINWYNKGLALDNQSKYDDAIKAYDEAIKLDPKYADAWTNKGIALENLKEYDKALKAYNNAIDLDPKDTRAWLFKGYALLESGKYQETYNYSIHSGQSNNLDIITVHLKNSFRGSDTNIATVDRIKQLSDSPPYDVLIHDENASIITSAIPLMLKEGYELAVKSVDTPGNRAYMELSKNGTVVDSKIIIPPNNGPETYN